MCEDDEAAHFKQVLREELVDAGHDGVRITPDNVVSAGELIKQDEARPFLNGLATSASEASETEYWMSDQECVARRISALCAELRDEAAKVGLNGLALIMQLAILEAGEHHPQQVELN